MKVEVRVTNIFKRQAKLLLKKFNSLSDELIKLEETLLDDPTLGTPLGKNAFKIRLSVKSKGKGKRGGMRVITYLESELIGIIKTENQKIIVNLISIYDKSDTANITPKELKELIENIN